MGIYLFLQVVKMVQPLKYDRWEFLAGGIVIETKMLFSGCVILRDSLGIRSTWSNTDYISFIEHASINSTCPTGRGTILLDRVGIPQCFSESLDKSIIHIPKFALSISIPLKNKLHTNFRNESPKCIPVNFSSILNKHLQVFYLKLSNLFRSHKFQIYRYSEHNNSFSIYQTIFTSNLWTKNN